MSNNKLRSVGGTAAALAAGLVLVWAPSASAAAAPGFGQHVRDCAQTMGFSGTHNPGMHQGASGWDGLPCES